jgi:hypothetical protein
MNTKNLKIAVTLGVLASAALLLSVRHLVAPDGLFEYAAALSIAGLAAMEYRIDWKRIFGR